MKRRDIVSKCKRGKVRRSLQLFHLLNWLRDDAYLSIKTTIQNADSDRRTIQSLTQYDVNLEHRKRRMASPMK